MLTRIIIIYIALPRGALAKYCGANCGPHWANIGLPGAQLGDLGLLAQAGWNQHQPKQLKDAVGNERHEGGGNRPGQDGGHVIQ